MKDIEIINEQELDYIKIYDCGLERGQKAWKYGPTIRNHHLIHYVFSGKGKIKLYGKTYVCNAGTLMWIPPYNPVTYEADDNDPWYNGWIGIAGGESTTLYEDVGFSLQNPIICCESKLLDTCFREMVEQYKKYDDISRLKTLSIFYEVLSMLQESVRHTRKENTPLLQKALDRIQNDYWKTLKISDIAADLGIDRSYLYKIFNDALNISPKQYLNDYRLAVAYELLRTGNYSVIRVSKAVGFQSPVTFSTDFKNKYHISPSEHMKRCATKK